MDNFDGFQGKVDVKMLSFIVVLATFTSSSTSPQSDVLMTFITIDP